MKKHFLIALPLAAMMVLPAAAQTSNTNSSSSSQQTTQSPADPKWQGSGQAADVQTGISNQPSNQQANSQDGSASNDNLGPRQPLQPDTRQGFWGKLNPFARKKYVQRQMSPIRNRVNELDELTANNTRMLKDVDARATQGIQLATNKANEADQHALTAGQHADQANQTAQQATSRLQNVEQVVGNIDDYKQASTAEVKFRAGQTVLSKSAKSDIDNMVQSLANQRGYVIQVQGFSPGRGQAAIQSSQAMAQSVARYLVIEHQIPVYRIFVVGMGNAPVQSAEGQAKKVRGGRVEVAVLKNNIDQLQSASAAAGQANYAGQGGVSGAASDNSASSNSAAQPSSTSGNNSAASAPWQKQVPAAQMPNGSQSQQQQQQKPSGDQQPK